MRQEKKGAWPLLPVTSVSDAVITQVLAAASQTSNSPVRFIIELSLLSGSLQLATFAVSYLNSRNKPTPRDERPHMGRCETLQYKEHLSKRSRSMKRMVKFYSLLGSSLASLLVSYMGGTETTGGGRTGGHSNQRARHWHLRNIARCCSRPSV